ncbi:MAG: NADPH-dependent FMN reductase, partial [Rhodobacterales bacterium CG_4_10_14_0_8_um_filter_70_9]
MKLLGISGSLRAASLNTALARAAAEAFAPAAFTLADLNLPLYD